MSFLWQGDDTEGDLDNKNPDLSDTENSDNNTQKNDTKINTTNILLLAFGGCSVVLIFVVVLKIFKNKRKIKMW